MSNKLFKNQIYACLVELLCDDEYYYQSVVGTSYNKLTPEGERAIIEYINMIAPHIIMKNRDELVNLAKQITWNKISS